MAELSEYCVQRAWLLFRNMLATQGHCSHHVQLPNHHSPQDLWLSERVPRSAFFSIRCLGTVQHLLASHHHELRTIEIERESCTRVMETPNRPLDALVLARGLRCPRRTVRSGEVGDQRPTHQVWYTVHRRGIVTMCLPAYTFDLPSSKPERTVPER